MSARSFLADILLVIHFAYVGFVVLGLVCIWLGYFLRWQWVRNFYFRLTHLVAMGLVAFEAVSGITCPLTVWEERLRAMGGEANHYGGSFVQHWIHKIIFFEAEPRIFTFIYLLVFALIVLSLWLVKPHWPKRR